jgi:hypothetical protein
MGYYAYINLSTDKLINDYSIIPFTWQTIAVNVISHGQQCDHERDGFKR